MEKMILIPYERYKKLKSEKKGAKMTGEGDKVKAPRLGPPGTPEKTKTWIKLGSELLCKGKHKVST